MMSNLGQQTVRVELEVQEYKRMNLDKQEIQDAIDKEISQAEKIYGKDVKFTLLNIIGLIKMLAPEKTEEKPSRLIPLSEWKNYHSYPTVGALRQYYNRKETNGFDYCIVYGGERGTRLLIDENKFFEWLKSRKKIA